MKKNTKRKSSQKKTKRIIVFGFFSVAIIAFVLISVLKIVNQIVVKYQEARELEKKMADLEEEAENLNNEIKRLQDEEYLARYAREKYFYSKDGELIIRIPTEDEKSQ